MGNQASRLDPYSEFKDEDLPGEIKNLQKQLSRYCQEEALRIIVCGDRRAGKSAFINNILSALQGTLVQVAKVGTPDDGVTKKYIEYKISLGHEQDKPVIVLCDTKGVGTKDTTKQIEAVIAAVEGKFNPKQTMGPTPKWRTGRKKHAVYVIIVREATLMISPNGGDSQDSTWKDVESYTNAKSIPMAIVLTKCDELDAAVGKDIAKLYKSPKVDEAISAASKMFHGLPKNRIFPIVNYTDQRKADPAMKVQILYALREIVRDVEVYMSSVVD